MKNNKIVISIIVILVLTIIIQLVYFGNKTKNIADKSNSIALNNTSYQTTSEKMNVKNIVELYKNYNGELSQWDIESIIYKIVNTDIYSLKDIAKKKNVDELQKYYDENKNEINNLGIYDKENFIFITEDINNIFRQEYVILRNAEIKMIDDKNDDNDYYGFYLLITYNNDANINLKCNIAKRKDNEERIKITSNSDIAQLYQKYSVVTGIKELITTLNDFIDSMKQIHEDTRLKSLNYQSQYYNLNIPKLNKIGIQSDKDFKSVAYEINTNISWIDNVGFSYYKVDLDSYKEENGYKIFKITFNFEQTEKFELNIGIAQAISIPSIKIYGQNGDL